MKKLFLLVMCLVMAIAMAGCGGSADKAKAPEKVLKVGTDANFPPFEYYLKDAKTHTGFDIELMRAVAKQAGYDKVEFVNIQFKDILNELNMGKVDAAIAAISYTDERASKTDFTDNYLETGLRIVTGIKGEEGNGPSIMKGKKVAVEEGSIGVAAAKKFGAAQVYEAKDTEEAIKMVAEGITDYAIANETVESFFITNGYGDKVKFATKQLTIDHLCIAVKKGNKNLVEKLNAALSEVERSGTYKKIYTSYFGKSE